MKQLIILVSAILVSTCSFADVSKALSSAWKNQQSSTNLQLSKNDITMGYGGADVSRRPTLDPRSTAA